MVKILRLFIFCYLLLVSFGTLGQDTIKAMHYNMLYYGYYTDFCTQDNNSMAYKEEQLSTIIDHFLPDIFSANEMGSGSSKVSRLLNNALNKNNPDYYKPASYTNVAFSSLVNAFYYNSEKFGLIDEKVVNTLLRDINLYRLYYKTPDLEQTRDTIFLTCIVGHLKAGSDASDKQTRTAMISNVMDYLEQNNYSGNILFMGDFNMRSSHEQAYQLMVNHSNEDIRLYDPIDIPGVWHNNSAMAAYHTQSVRSGTQSCFASGGMDDRFDFILSSDDVMHGSDRILYLDGTYHAVGQDGNRFNQSLISPINSTEPEEVLMSMYNFSDHLPVMMSMLVDPNLISNKPQFAPEMEITLTNPVTNKLNIHFQNVNSPFRIELFSLTGMLLESFMFAGNERTELDFSSLKSGLYILHISDSSHSAQVKKVIKL